MSRLGALFGIFTFGIVLLSLRFYFKTTRRSLSVLRLKGLCDGEARFIHRVSQVINARAEEVERELASLSIRLHASLVRAGLHRAK